MKLSHVIIACASGIFIYLLGLGLLGPQGLFSLQEKEAYIGKLRVQIEMLEALQASLANSAAALESNPELLTREANRLRYLRPDQRIVRILDGKSMHRSSSPGAPLEREAYVAPDMSLFQVAGLGTFLLILIVCNIIPSRRGRDDDKVDGELTGHPGQPVPRQHP